MRKTSVRALPALVRANLSAAVAVSALAGYLHCCGSFSIKAVAIGAGVFLLAAAASAFNQVQEASTDSLMQRTLDRPLPQQLFSIRQSVFIGAILGLTGLVLLAALGSLPSALVGLFTLVWYNGVYTPLKKRTRFAFLYGAVCGSLPPVMGILACGQMCTVWNMVLIALFMYAWQIPHFILILQKHLPAYSAAQLPTPAFISSERKVATIVCVTSLFTVGTTLLFPLCNVVTAGANTVVLLLIDACAVAYLLHKLIRPARGIPLRSMFVGLSLYQMIVFVILVF